MLLVRESVQVNAIDDPVICKRIDGFFVKTRLLVKGIQALSKSGIAARNQSNIWR
jgi:hypothetical protein